VRTFFRKFLRHSKGEWAGKPFELLDWQWRDIVAPLFGWKRADGTRRYPVGANSAWNILRRRWLSNALTAICTAG
jgi:hypothetical protein